jgi:tetratricopeptide (TPR) repeat protein
MKMLRNLLCLLLLAGAADLYADALIKPLPKPDLGKLPAETAKQLTEARAQFEQGKVNLSIDRLAVAYGALGALYFHAGLFDVADLAFYDANQLMPMDVRWVYLRGVVASAQKRTSDARANYEAALALGVDYLPIRYRLADTLIELGDLDGAHKVLEAGLAAHKDVATLPAMLGRLEVRQKRYAEAVAHLQSALTIEPGANGLYKDLADAYTAQGNTQAAKEAQSKAGPNQPELADPIVAEVSGAAAQGIHGTPLEQARQLLAQRSFPEARDKVGEALRANGEDAEAWALAARLDAIMNRADDAQSEATRALKLKPDSANANMTQGMVFEFRGDDANAYGYYQRAVQLDRNQPDARLLFGNALMRRGDYLPAAEEYRHLVEIAPQTESAYARLAAALVAGGRCNEALTGVNAALAKRSRDGELMQVFVRLASTCASASSQERGMALDYARTLYKEQPDATNATALALAFAAQGKFDEAQKSQAEAIFDATRYGDTERAQLYRETMRLYAAKQVPDRPWPAGGVLFKPPLLRPLPTLPAPKS